MDGASSDLTAFILAGGKSTRMGADKAFVMLNGCTLLDQALERARAITGEVCIVGNASKFAAFAPVAEDVFPGCGPLGGIHAALRASRTELNLMLAVDVPLVSQALLQYLIGRARDVPSAAVTVAKAGTRWQPLCGIYRREFADAAEEALQAGCYKIDALFATTSTQVVEQKELEAAGFSVKMFRNLNTREELEAVRGVL